MISAGVGGGGPGGGGGASRSELQFIPTSELRQLESGLQKGGGGTRPLALRAAERTCLPACPPCPPAPTHDLPRRWMDARCWNTNPASIPLLRLELRFSSFLTHWPVFFFPANKASWQSRQLSRAKRPVFATALFIYKFAEGPPPLPP